MDKCLRGVVEEEDCLAAPLLESLCSGACFFLLWRHPGRAKNDESDAAVLPPGQRVMSAPPQRQPGPFLAPTRRVQNFVCRRMASRACSTFAASLYTGLGGGGRKKGYILVFIFREFRVF